MSKKNIIPIFIPFQGCPHLCVYCNQNRITGNEETLSLDGIRQRIEEQISYFKRDHPIEVAFYGGTFTMLPFSKQLEYFEGVQNYMEKGIIDSIRFSTRPDAIRKNELVELKKMGLKTVELGIQSIDSIVREASGRGGNIKIYEESIETIRQLELDLGLQQMIGLPEDTFEKTMDTARWIKKMKADFVRIYPTLVIRDTELEVMYKKGQYHPLSLEESVEWVAELLEFYSKHKISVIRVGLPPFEEESSFVAGPVHPQMREWANSLRVYYRTRSVLEGNEIGNHLIIKGTQKNINGLVGPNKIGKKKIEDAFNVRVQFVNTKNPEKFLIDTGKETLEVSMKDFR